MKGRNYGECWKYAKIERETSIRNRSSAIYIYK